MNAIIEHMPCRKETTFYQDLAIEFITYRILEGISHAYNEENLRQIMSEVMTNATCHGYCGNDIFEYGFGSSHMWVAQYLRVTKKVRNFFVEF